MGADNTTLGQGYMCCHSGEAVPFESTRYQDYGFPVEYDYWGNWVCDHSSKNGTECIAGSCETDTECRDGVCVPQTGANGLYGDPCERDHSQCASGFCWKGVCQEEPRICPDPDLTFLAGYRIDPFCRTTDVWCQYTDLSLLRDSLEDNFFLETGYYIGLGENGTLCADILSMLSALKLVRLIDETDAEIGVSYVIENLDNIEEVVVEDWTYFVLLSIAIMGVFALAAILRKIILPKTDARPKEYKTKLAGASKVTNMIENAMMLHSRNNSQGRVMVSSQTIFHV